MKKIYITGISASGKSTLGKELEKRGYPVVDIDETGACKWYRNDTHEVADYHPGVGKQWLKEHDWVCDFSQIEKKIEALSDNEAVFVAGITINQDSFLKKFDHVFLLRIDPETLLHRLKNRTTNYFGKDESEQEHLLEIKDSFEKWMINLGAQTLDASKPMEQLADDILKKINH